MAWQPDYTTVAELKAYLRIGDTVDDTQLAAAITTASRDVDQLTSRQFGLADTPAARVYTWEGDMVDGLRALPIDDLMTTTGLAVAVDLDNDATFEQALTVSVDFDLWPWNAAADGRPWTHLVLRRSSTWRWPTTARGVEVTARWGWTTVPPPIAEATRLQASRVFAVRNAPFGVAGSPELGSELRLLDRVHPEVAVAVRPYRRVWGAV